MSQQPLKVVCAWCGKHLSGDPACKQVSHGICAPCSARELAAMRGQNPLDEDIRHLERAAALGDEFAKVKLLRLKQRAGIKWKRKQVSIVLSGESVPVKAKDAVVYRNWSVFPALRRRVGGFLYQDHLEWSVSNLWAGVRLTDFPSRKEAMAAVEALEGSGHDFSGDPGKWTPEAVDFARRIHDLKYGGTSGKIASFERPYDKYENPMNACCNNPRCRYSNPGLSPAKARQILHDRKVHGRPLTERQRRFFGAVASGYPIWSKNPLGPAFVEGISAGAGFALANAGIKRLGKQMRYQNFAASRNPGPAGMVADVANLGTSVYAGLKAARGVGLLNPRKRHKPGCACAACSAGGAAPDLGYCAGCAEYVRPSGQRRCSPCLAKERAWRARTINPRKRHKPGCACAACSAHRKKVGSRTGAAGAPHVKALDGYIAKNMKGDVKRVQMRLCSALRTGCYSRSAGSACWRHLIDKACKKSKIPLSAAHRAQMASQVAQAFERKMRHSNPMVAIVGAGLNPRDRNPTDSRKRGDRGYVKTITLAEARRRAVAAGMGKQFDENVRAHKKFHGAMPTNVRVYQSHDGKKGTTVEVGSISGRVPETTYIAGKVVKRSPSKASKFWVHKHPAKGMPIEVWMAHKKSALKIGGTQKRSGWYYS